jgi:hypothetical protein
MTPLRPYLWGGGATLVLFAGAVVALFGLAAGLADRDLPGSASRILPARTGSVVIAHGMTDRVHNPGHPPARRKLEASAVPAGGLSTAPPGALPLGVDRGTRKSRQGDSQAAGTRSAGAGSRGSGGMRLASSAPGNGGTAPPDTAQTGRTGGTSSRLARKR